jgi:membrane associated rhomboid family serine protease
MQVSKIMLFFLSSMLSSLMYYAQSFKTGLAANKLALAGLIFGTAIYPLFKSRQKIKLLKTKVLGNT